MGELMMVFSAIEYDRLTATVLAGILANPTFLNGKYALKDHVTMAHQYVQALLAHDLRNDYAKSHVFSLGDSVPTAAGDSPGSGDDPDVDGFAELFGTKD